MLPMDAARLSIQDGSEARDEVVHACCESESGSSDDSSAMCCCRGSSAESFAQLPMVQVRSAKAKAATRAGMARCGVGRGHGHVSTPEGGLKGQGGEAGGGRRRGEEKTDPFVWAGHPFVWAGPSFNDPFVWAALC